MKHNTILFFIILPLVLCSQNQGLDYNQWKYPVVKIRAFNIDNSYDGNSALDFNSEKNNYFDVNGNGSISVGYSIFRNEDKIQNQRSMSLNVGFSDERSNYSINYSNNYRKYFEKEDRNGLYFELQPRVRIDFYDQTSSSQKSFDLNLNIKLGKGRIEPMRDVFLAQFMIDDLVAENLLDSVYDQNLIFELANVMILARSKRIFDSRFARKYQLKTLCDFLVSKGIDSGIDLFNIVNDHWFATVYNDRSVGSRASIGIVSELYHNYHIYKDIPSSSKSGYVSVLLDYNYTKPINQHWHKTFYTAAGVAQDPSEKVDRGYNVQGKFIISYFPTTRTYFTASVSTSFLTHDFKQARIASGFALETSIFITNTIRINGNISVNRLKNNIYKSDRFYRLSQYDNNLFEYNYFNRDYNVDYDSNNIDINYGISMRYIFF